YANAHFIVLNDSVASGMTIAGTEAAFLRADLAMVDRTRTPWIFAMHHQPFYTCLSTHAPDADVFNGWQPIFDQYEVDIGFAGHNHVYERSKPIRGASSGTGVIAPSSGNGVPTISTGSHPSGTIYVVAAGVGAPLYNVSESCAFTFMGRQLRTYVIV